MDELLDLVNEKDEVIGEVWKSQANSDSKVIHREISVMIVDVQGKILLQQRSKQKLKKPGFWTTSCAGHVGKGESTELAAHRELKEELGFDTELKLVKKMLERLETETRFDYFYIGNSPYALEFC